MAVMNIVLGRSVSMLVLGRQTIVLVSDEFKVRLFSAAQSCILVSSALIIIIIIRMNIVMWTLLSRKVLEQIYK